MTYVHFELVSAITEVVTIATGRGIRDLARLRRRHGPGRWRKCKGVAAIRLGSGARGVLSYAGTRLTESGG